MTKKIDLMKTLPSPVQRHQWYSIYIYVPRIFVCSNDASFKYIKSFLQGHVSSRRCNTKHCFSQEIWVYLVVLPYTVCLFGYSPDKSACVSMTVCRADSWLQVILCSPFLKRDQSLYQITADLLVQLLQLGRLQKV